MHAESKALLKEAVQKCLPVLQPLVGKYDHLCQVWKKMGEGRWQGQIVSRPNIQRTVNAIDEQLKVAGQPFAKSFLSHHPEYNGLVGFRRYGLINLGQDITNILRSAIQHLWRRYKTFDLDDAKVDLLVNEFEAFVDNPTVRFRFRSQLLNFKTPGNSIDLAEGLAIRRMTDEEVSADHGGPVETLGMIRPRTSGPYEFCIEGETKELKVFGNQVDDEPPSEDRVQASLDKAIVCLRTFKAGHVGYDYVHFYPRTFSPLAIPSIGYGDRYVPFGSYTLNVEESGKLTEHAKMVFGASEPSMEMACSRLADAETRTKPRDRLIDAVIGMEALLLAGLRNEDRRGELRFRFSLHYSTLCSTPEDRLQAFKLAKNLYDLRSKVAHGSTLDDSERVGDEKLKLPDAAKRASETLRKLVLHFLPNANQAPYKNHEFWQRAYFGLPDAQTKKGQVN